MVIDVARARTGFVELLALVGWLSACSRDILVSYADDPNHYYFGQTR